MNCKINVDDLYRDIGKLIEDIIVYNNNFPFKCYLDVQDYLSDNINWYKGLLIWESNKYYKTELLNNLESGDVGFFIIPEFSDIDVLFYQEYSMTISIMILTNVEKDRFSSNLMIMSDYIINKIKDEFKITMNSQGIYIKRINISKVIPDNNYSSFYKRTLLITISKCIC